VNQRPQREGKKNLFSQPPGGRLAKAENKNVPGLGVPGGKEKSRGGGIVWGTQKRPKRKGDHSTVGGSEVIRWSPGGEKGGPTSTQQIQNAAISRRPYSSSDLKKKKKLIEEKRSEEGSKVKCHSVTGRDAVQRYWICDMNPHPPKKRPRSLLFNGRKLGAGLWLSKDGETGGKARNNDVAVIPKGESCVSH